MGLNDCISLLISWSVHSVFYLGLFFLSDCYSRRNAEHYTWMWAGENAFHFLPIVLIFCLQYQEKEAKKSETKEKPQKRYDSEKEEKGRKEHKGLKSK